MVAFAPQKAMRKAGEGVDLQQGFAYLNVR
jgi:hypothetical protein